ncbi:aspartic proteinase CDR1-like [Senna tora]|uniref:Aspartic proteinase CDR1-like n=1 Tax=Senna tora TaxID=362788 RepID=A0A835CF30_9FABA|nr:aspartic proteinase CDR1-like [Senna tora]
MASYFISSISFTLIFILSIILCSTTAENIPDGFSVELIHNIHDSSETPFYQRVNDALRRSVKRVRHFFPHSHSQPQDQSEAEVISIRGEYIMEYSLGTPPVRIFGILDTGSDLVWTQCKLCPLCYNQTAPLFDPSKSNTYRTVPCKAKPCLSASPSVGRTSCGVKSPSCEYNIRYGDGSVSNGGIAMDTIRLGSTGGRTVAFRNSVFGCGHDNEGTFTAETSGIVGLGRGAISLVSQMGSSIEGKFSYCLVPIFSEKNTSKLNFGQNAVVSGRGTVSTPMVSKRPPSFYYLTLEGMSVGNKKLHYTNSVNYSVSGRKVVEEGNIIIDSGTTLTLLEVDFYSKLEAEVASHIKLKRVRDPGQFLSLCYASKTQFLEEAPIITAHFKGANVWLYPRNTFVKVADDVSCFAFRAVGRGGAIFGNLAQMNYLVGYDLQKNVVSFKAADCTKM